MIPQANALCKAGHSVDVIFGDSTVGYEKSFSNVAKKIFISADDAFSMLEGIYNPHQQLYKNDDFQFIQIREILSKKLAKDYDVILLWENPVPFLEKMYPNALIVHQMPGFFSRDPYPHLISFDVSGLYRKSTFYSDWKNVVTYTNSFNLGNEYRETSHNIFSTLDVFKDHIDKSRKTFNKIHLLPLQVSAHYAFYMNESLLFPQCTLVA